MTTRERRHARAAQRASWAPGGVALTRAGFRPSRSKGQNFLVQPAVADRIVAAARLAPGEDVIEIGPGLGILSERIATCPIRRLWLVEVDPVLAGKLKERFKFRPNVQVIRSDFLQVELAGFLSDRTAKVIGNLPFSAAAAILRKLSESRRMISRMVLMFQHEVGERLRAHPGNRSYGAFSAITALYWEIDMHFKVGAGNFHPRPKVDAQVLALRPRAVAAFEVHEEGAVLEAIRAAFSTRRKTLRNALSAALGAEPSVVEDALRRAAIDPNARGETLRVEDFVRFVRALNKTRNA